jgi:hypothetical protein
MNDPTNLVFIQPFNNYFLYIRVYKNQSSFTPSWNSVQVSCNYNHEAVDITAEAAMTPSSTNDAMKWHDVMHIFVSKAPTPRKPDLPLDIQAGELWKFTKEISNSNWHICNLRYLHSSSTNSLTAAWYISRQ